MVVQEILNAGDNSEDMDDDNIKEYNGDEEGIGSHLLSTTGKLDDKDGTLMPGTVVASAGVSISVNEEKGKKKKADKNDDENDEKAEKTGKKKKGADDKKKKKTNK